MHHSSFLLSTVSSVLLISAFLCTHTALLERLFYTVAWLKLQGFNNFCHICRCWFAQAFTFVGLFIIVAAIGDENHQKLVVWLLS
jgi:hypothetical protein